MSSAPFEETFLSIITVVRNDPERLAATIESLGELYSDPRFEHVVIDGRSTDIKTLQLIQKASRHQNFKFVSEPDLGIYDAMNKGVHLSNGRFMLFLNSGDRLLASCSQLAMWLDALDGMQGVQLACFNCQMRQGAQLTLLEPQSATTYKMPTSHQAMVFSSAFMRSNLYDIRYRIAADFNLFLSADPARTVVFRDGILTEIEAVGVASENPAQSYKEYLQIARRKLRGWSLWAAMTLIGCKGALVVAMKNALPRRWVHGLRRWI